MSPTTADEGDTWPGKSHGKEAGYFEIDWVEEAAERDTAISKEVPFKF